MTTDREVLVELLDDLDDYLRDPHEPIAPAALWQAAERARAHLQSTSLTGCAIEVDRASAAAYAAGQARNAQAHP